MPTTVKRGQTYEKRRSGVLREVIGFTTKPDGIRRARLREVGSNGAETKVRVDQLLKSYQLYPYRIIY